MIIISPRKNKYSSSYDYLNEENIDFTKLVIIYQKLKIFIFHFLRFEFEYSITLNKILKI